MVLYWHLQGGPSYVAASDSRHGSFHRMDYTIHHRGGGKLTTTEAKVLPLQELSPPSLILTILPGKIRAKSSSLSLNKVNQVCP